MQSKDVEHLPDMLLNIEDYRTVAKTKLTKPAFDYYDTGADDLVTLKDNKKAFNRIRLLPRVMVDVSKITTKVSLLGGRHTIDSPIMIAPCAMHGLAYPHGDDNSGAERATARAAAKHNTLMIVSTYATTHMEEIIQPVRKHSKIPFWYQLYVLKDRKITEFMVTNAEKLGYSAIVVTVDAPSIGNRELDARNSFGLPPGLTYPNVMMAKKEGITHKDFAQDAIDPTLSWKDIQWLKSITHLPVIIKGIMTKEDAILAVHHGASAIIVSNHGARQLDTVMATIDALPSITRAVKEYGIDVYVDGGIRRGTDVLKCLCLGAKAVLVARPILWGLAVDGEKGVFDVIQILRKELETAMVLAGIPDVKNCTSAQVYRERRAKL